MRWPSRSSSSSRSKVSGRSRSCKDQSTGKEPAITHASVPVLLAAIPMRQIPDPVEEVAYTALTYREASSLECPALHKHPAVHTDLVRVASVQQLRRVEEEHKTLDLQVVHMHSDPSSAVEEQSRLHLSGLTNRSALIYWSQTTTNRPCGADEPAPISDMKLSNSASIFIRSPADRSARSMRVCWVFRFLLISKQSVV